MSVRVKGKHASAPKVDESLTTPKKRKHDAEERDASEKKKKKKPRTEVAEDPAEVTEQASEKKDKKKKMRQKSKDLKDATEQTNEETLKSEDVEVPDADLDEQEPDAEDVQEPSSNALEAEEEIGEVLPLLESEDPTSFYSTRLSLQLPIPAVSLGSTMSSLLALHLAPLLLTYFPPAQGIVLGFSDPVLSATPDSGLNLPLVAPKDGETPGKLEILARTADEFGVSWVWLTANFLVFRPERGDELFGWTNVTSEGFVGLVSYNYFQTAVGKNRIPENWSWNGPNKEPVQTQKKKGRKAKLRDEDNLGDTPMDGAQEDVTANNSSSQVPESDDAGHFADATGNKIESTLKFRVVDTEVVPAHDRHKWSLQIDGTLLDNEAEEQVLEEEHAKFHRAEERMPSAGGDPVMSGALRLSREASVASRLSGHIPGRH